MVEHDFNNTQLLNSVRTMNFLFPGNGEGYKEALEKEIAWAKLSV